MTLFFRRQTLVGITATGTVLALPAVAKATPAKNWPCQGIETYVQAVPTWDLFALSAESETATSED
jgi:hypothetical protein